MPKAEEVRVAGSELPELRGLQTALEGVFQYSTDQNSFQPVSDLVRTREDGPLSFKWISRTCASDPATDRYFAPSEGCTASVLEILRQSNLSQGGASVQGNRYFSSVTGGTGESASKRAQSIYLQLRRGETRTISLRITLVPARGHFTAECIITSSLDKEGTAKISLISPDIVSLNFDDGIPRFGRLPSLIEIARDGSALSPFGSEALTSELYAQVRDIARQWTPISWSAESQLVAKDDMTLASGETFRVQLKVTPFTPASNRYYCL